MTRPSTPSSSVTRPPSGAESAAAARASIPSADAKAKAWEAIAEPDALSAAMLRATTESFWHVEQLDLCAPYVEPYLAALPEIWRSAAIGDGVGHHGLDVPRAARISGTVEKVGHALASDIDDALRRLLIEGRAELKRALRARAVDLVDQPTPASVTSSA